MPARAKHRSEQSYSEPKMVKRVAALPGQLGLLVPDVAAPTVTSTAKAGSVVAVTCRTCSLEFRAIAGEQAEKESLCTPCWYKAKETKGKRK